MAYKDKVFYKYIADLITRHEDEEDSILMADKLMIRAANKYKVLKSTKQWLVLNEVKQEVLVMKTQLSKLNISNNKKKHHCHQGGNPWK